VEFHEDVLQVGGVRLHHEFDILVPVEEIGEYVFRQKVFVGHQQVLSVAVDPQDLHAVVNDVVL